jgi:Spherulation-specific family 4
MSRSNSSPRSPLFLFAFTAVALPQLPTPSLSHTLGIIVPAYFYPGAGGPGGAGDGWAAMDAAATQVPLTAVLNPDNGPGAAQDPNYAIAVNKLEAAGGKVVGYVGTSYASVPLSSVEGEVSTFITLYPEIDGFFLDQASNSPAALPYYQALYAYIVGLSSSYRMIINPGMATDQAYLSASPPTADVFNTFENLNVDYPGATPPSWVHLYSASRFSNVVYDAPASSVDADIELAAARNAGSIYITDQTTPNPFDELPSYWDQEVAAIAARNGASVPELSTLSLLGIGGLLTFAAAAVKRRKLA